MVKQNESPWGEVKKALKYMIRSGALTVGFSVIIALLSQKANGEINWEVFGLLLGGAVLQIINNTAIYWNEKRK